jgi:hypothetical protein
MRSNRTDKREAPPAGEKNQQTSELGRKLEKLSRKAKADTGRALSLSEIRRELSQARG